MIRSRRFWLGVALGAAALVIFANWHLVTVAFQSHPGCVDVAHPLPAATPGC
ncbi:MAG: hypothetical protein ACOH2M_21615 [Cypionkella sp.]